MGAEWLEEEISLVFAARHFRATCLVIFDRLLQLVLVLRLTVHHGKAIYYLGRNLYIYPSLKDVLYRSRAILRTV